MGCTGCWRERAWNLFAMKMEADVMRARGGGAMSTSPPCIPGARTPIWCGTPPPSTQSLG